MTLVNGYLKPHFLAEPLIGQWFAWAYLVSPVTAAMYIEHAHLKMMQGFVSAPHLHVSALKNPAMAGGPFISYPSSRSGEIKTLMEKTMKQCAESRELAQAIGKAEDLLRKEARGFSLEPLYAKLPKQLQGYVELYYDLNNQSAIRFMEGLLYKSPFYNESAQGVALSLQEKEDRPYLLSTPRLMDDTHLYLDLPFKSPLLDTLFEAASSPVNVDELSEQLNIPKEKRELFASFFTQEPPPSAKRYDGDEVKIQYFGHACVLLQTKDVCILFDPIISSERESDIPRYTNADLPNEIDYVVITHSHGDHFMLETLLRLRHKTKHFVVPRNNSGALSDPSLKLVLQQTGFTNVIELDEIEEVLLPGGTLISIPFLGEHGDLNIRSKSAFLVKLLGRSFMLAADSNNIDPQLYRHIHDIYGHVDILFLGMECAGAPLSWPYGPLLTKPLPRGMDQSRRVDGSNFERGLKLVEQLHCGQVYIYAMGYEPWLTHITAVGYSNETEPHLQSGQLIEHLCHNGIHADRLHGSKTLFL